MPVCGLRLENGEWLELPAGGGKTTRMVAQAYKDFVNKYVGDHAALKLF
jgi:hypothetical protein